MPFNLIKFKHSPSNNIKVLKCYKKLFTKKGQSYNIGSYILLSIIFLYIVILIYLIVKDYSILKREIKELFYFSQTNNNNININKIVAKNFKNKNKNNFLKSKSSIASINSKNADSDFSYPPPIFNQFLYINNNKRINKKAPIIIKHLKENRYKYNQIITQKNNSLITTNMKLDEKLFLTEYELNYCSYKKALLYDKRTFCQYFFCLLKSEHLLFFAIIPSKDYNSQAIKICIFLFTFALFFADNAIFMNEDTIHNIYENQGDLDIIYQIPQIIYSNIISSIIDKIIRFLSLSQDDVINKKKKLRREKKKNEFVTFFRILFTKYIFFFIISFLLLFLFWLYISCFCFVYRNTQKYLIKDTLFSFGISLSLPFIFYFLSAVFRIFSLKKRNRNYFYILSKLILIL